MDSARFTSEFAERFTADTAQLFDALLHELVKGEPVRPETLARVLGWPVDRVTDTLGQRVSTEWDGNGSVVGHGLTLRETPHVFEVGGQRLYAWCAFDTLIFPALLNETAHVTSRCAVTGEPISLAVTPDAVQALAPPDAAMSLLPPQDMSDVRRTFCCHVHFFVSTAIGQDWASGRAGFEIVGVHDAFGMGQELVRRIIDARQHRHRVPIADVQR